MAQRQEAPVAPAPPSATGHGTITGATAPPAASVKVPFTAVQNGWLKRMRGRGIRIQLQSGEVITGVLEADDSYTLALRIPGAEETALVYKHSIAYLVPATKR